LDPTDMAVSKLVAWREKDKEFLGVMLESKLIHRDELERRHRRFLRADCLNTGSSPQI
jgi:hypothetical protein